MKSSFDSAIAFFSSLKGNPSLLQNTPSPLYDGYLQVLKDKQAKDDDLTRWAISSPLAGSYGDSFKVNIDRNGYVSVPAQYRIVADTRKEMLVNRPTSIRSVGPAHNRQLWVTSLHADIARFSENGSYIGGFGTMGDAGTNNSVYEAVSDVAVDVTANLVAVASAETHQVRVYDLRTNEFKYAIGSYNLPGEPTDVEPHLYEPSSLLWLGGKLVVACRKGVVNRQGFVASFNADGTFDRIVLGSDAENSGEPWHGGITDPIHLFATPDNVVFITSYSRNYVASFIVENDVWSYHTCYGRTGGGFGGGILRPSSCCVDGENNRLYVTFTDPDVLVCFDLVTHALLGKFGKMAWDDAAVQDGSTVKINNLYQLTSVILSGDTIYLSNMGNNRIVSLPDHLLYGNQTIFVSYSAINLSKKEVVRSSKENINVDPSGNVTYRASRERLYTDGLGTEKITFIVLRELDR